MSENATLSCPSCGSAMIRKWGSVGPFMGCTAYPLCRHTVDLSGTPNEHPLVRTRRLALRWLQKRPQWSEDDRADAVGDALVAAMRSGWAERVEAWRFVAKHAYRALRGWQVMNGKRYSARSRAGAKPVASSQMWARPKDRTFVAGERGIARVEPDVWLDQQPGPRPDPEAALDLAAQLDREEGSETIQEALTSLAHLGLTRGDIAQETGYSKRTLTAWATSELQGCHPHRAERARLALVELLTKVRQGIVAPAQKATPQCPRPAPAKVTRRDGEPEGCWLVRQALAAGNTQTEVAQRLGVTQAAISRWSRAHTAPGAEHLPALRSFKVDAVSDNRP